MTEDVEFKEEIANFDGYLRAILEFKGTINEFSGGVFWLDDCFDDKKSSDIINQYYKDQHYFDFDGEKILDGGLGQLERDLGHLLTNPDIFGSEPAQEAFGSYIGFRIMDYVSAILGEKAYASRVELLVEKQPGDVIVENRGFSCIFYCLCTKMSALILQVYDKKAKS